MMVISYVHRLTLTGKPFASLIALAMYRQTKAVDKLNNIFFQHNHDD